MGLDLKECLGTYKMSAGCEMSLSTKNRHPKDLERLDGRRRCALVEGQLEASCL